MHQWNTVKYYFIQRDDLSNIFTMIILYTWTKLTRLWGDKPHSLQLMLLLWNNKVPGIHQQFLLRRWVGFLFFDIAGYNFSAEKDMIIEVFVISLLNIAGNCRRFHSLAVDNFTLIEQVTFFYNRSGNLFSRQRGKTGCLELIELPTSCLLYTSRCV